MTIGLTSDACSAYLVGMAEPVILYQIMNLDREELFYGITADPLEKELEKLASAFNSPAAGWKKGEVVTWRAITPEPLPTDLANLLWRELESKTPPNNFKVLKTLPKQEEDDGIIGA